MSERAEVDDLIDAWWATAEAMGIEGDEVRTDWHKNVFENILKHCGWTTQEWNEVVGDLSREER